MIGSSLAFAPRLALLLSVASFPGVCQTWAPMRPPAVPLVAHDPYFSVWSTTDRLYGSATSHWTGKPNSLTALARIDGTTYQLMGRERDSPEPLSQRSVQVLPTRTIYEFEGAGVKIELTYLTPALPDDLDLLSRPLTYLEFRVSSTSGEHAVQLYF